MQVLQEIRVEVPDLGAKIKEARLAKKYSMRKAAKLAGVSQPTWWGFEREEHGIKLETLRRIEKVLESKLLDELEEVYRIAQTSKQQLLLGEV